MYQPSSKNGFFSVPRFEPQSIHHSMDDIPLQPGKTQSQVSTAYPPGSTDLSLDLIDPAAYAAHERKPTTQSAPARHFWHNPFSLATVMFVGDLFLTLAPCLFLLLSFEALSVDGRPVSSPRGQTVEQAAKLGPTLFPIVFAAINLLAALERAVVLPGLGVLSIGVVLLWALSPVGGQSTLRVLVRGQSAAINSTTIYYFNNTGDDYSGLFQGASMYTTYVSALNAVFQATLGSIQRVKGSDIWGNVKIPVLEYMPNYFAGPDEDGWYDFDENNYDSPYSALNGIVVSGLRDGVDTNFTMETSYFNLTCSDPTIFNTAGSENGTLEGFADWAGDLFMRVDTSTQLFNGLYANTSNVGWSSYMVDTNYKSSIHLDSDPIYNIIYASKGVNAGWIAAYNCTMGNYHVESDILCTNSDCHVRRVRPSKNASWSTRGWPFPNNSTLLSYYLLTWLGTATGQQHPSSISPIDFYVSGSDTPFIASIGSAAEISYDNVTGEQFAKRLQSLVNTGWQLGYQNQATAQKPPDNETALALSTNPSTSSLYDGGVGYTTTATTGTTTSRHDIFIANKAWVTVTVIVAFILLFCGIASMIFKYGSRSPDILGFVSSMTRDNPNFEQIPGGGKLDGLQRARVLRHVRVQIADVQPWDQDGHVTLRNLGAKR